EGGSPLPGSGVSPAFPLFPRRRRRRTLRMEFDSLLVAEQKSCVKQQENIVCLEWRLKASF
ncbi:MAG TPA: hypothetical protein VHD63_23825, partial [Ktedonobacteraceae bacterium]|nr:hypothetical protein [Ktedonobacteraceae bacterium]